MIHVLGFTEDYLNSDWNERSDYERWQSETGNLKTSYGLRKKPLQVSKFARSRVGESRRTRNRGHSLGKENLLFRVSTQTFTGNYT